MPISCMDTGIILNGTVTSLASTDAILDFTKPCSISATELMSGTRSGSSNAENGWIENKEWTLFFYHTDESG